MVFCFVIVAGCLWPRVIVLFVRSELAGRRPQRLIIMRSVSRGSKSSASEPEVQLLEVSVKKQFASLLMKVLSSPSCGSNELACNRKRGFGLQELAEKKIVRGVCRSAPVDVKNLPKGVASLEELARESGRCLECGTRLVEKDADLVCPNPNCGIVWGEAYAENRIPFDESAVSDGHAENQYSPETNLDWSRGLGSKEDHGDIADVLGGKGARKDPMFWKRANNLRVTVTHPTIQSLLSFGSMFCENHGLHTEQEKDIRFADQLGVRLRCMGEYFVKYDAKHNLLVAASAVFAVTLRDLYPELYASHQGKFPELSLDPRYLDYYEALMNSFSYPLLPELPEALREASS